MPLISVIVPIYKVEQYIHRCVDSILNQSFSDFELILVDDGSPDNCGAICDEYAEKDPRVHVIHQKNGGLSAARNTGIDWSFANSDSKWITFLDSDDYWYEKYLEVLLQAVTECNTLIGTCNATVGDFSSDPAYYIPKKYETEIAYCDRSVIRHRIPAWAKLYAKELWKDIRYPVGKLHEDCFTTHKLLFQCSHIATVKARMYFVTPNPNSITHVKWSPKRLDAVEGMEEMLSYFQNSPYRKAELRTVLTLLHTIADSMSQINACDETPQFKSRYISDLQTKLRNYIKKYDKALNLSRKEHAHIYESAYPTRMRLYWSFHAILRKLKLCQ